MVTDSSTGEFKKAVTVLIRYVGGQLTKPLKTEEYLEK